MAKNFAGTKKVRNAILFCSVVIGIVAITMVFGISVGKIQAEEIRLIRENGTASSGRIEDGTEEQYAKLKQLDYIKQVGKSISHLFCARKIFSQKSDYVFIVIRNILMKHSDTS